MNRPHLLLLPGLLCDARLWQHQVKALSELAHVTVADLTRADSIAGLADDVLRQAPESCFVLVGFSLDGYVALEIMRQAPRRVAALALLDTSRGRAIGADRGRGPPHALGAAAASLQQSGALADRLAAPSAAGPGRMNVGSGQSLPDFGVVQRFNARVQGFAMDGLERAAVGRLEGRRVAHTAQSV